MVLGGFSGGMLSDCFTYDLGKNTLKKHQYIGEKSSTPSEIKINSFNNQCMRTLRNEVVGIVQDQHCDTLFVSISLPESMDRGCA